MKLPVATVGSWPTAVNQPLRLTTAHSLNPLIGEYFSALADALQKRSFGNKSSTRAADGVVGCAAELLNRATLE